jgi:hypothetical protein
MIKLKVVKVSQTLKKITQVGKFEKYFSNSDIKNQKFWTFFFENWKIIILLFVWMLNEAISTIKSKILKNPMSA